MCVSCVFLLLLHYLLINAPSRVRTVRRHALRQHEYELIAPKAIKDTKYFFRI